MFYAALGADTGKYQQQCQDLMQNIYLVDTLELWVSSARDHQNLWNLFALEISTLSFDLDRLRTTFMF